MAIQSLHTVNMGCFYADGGAMFGAIPRASWQRRYPHDDHNRCILAMRMGIIVTDCGRVILIDNGIGDKHFEQLSRSTYRFFDLITIEEALGRFGLTADRVTDVVLTHLHFDHCGYTTHMADGRPVPTFANARCHVSRTQWHYAAAPHPLDTDAYFPENIMPVEEAGRLCLLDADTRLCDGVELRLYDGHTVGQLAVYAEATGRTVVFAGDVVPIAAHLSPSWISAYDAAPQRSYDERIRMLDEVAERGYAVVYYHDAAISCSTVKRAGSFFKVDAKIAM